MWKRKHVPAFARPIEIDEVEDDVADGPGSSSPNNMDDLTTSNTRDSAEADPVKEVVFILIKQMNLALS